MTATLLLSAALRPPALLGAGRGAPVRAAAPLPECDFDLPTLAPCRHQPVLLVLLFDNSRSVTAGHDPVGNRFEEAAIALDHLRRRCHCRRTLVAVRTFDQRTSSDAGPVALDAAGWARISAALTRPPELIEGSSRMRRGLLSVERLAHAHPHHRTTLVVFSDFELLDAPVGAVYDRLRHFPGDVHALVLDARPPGRLRSSAATVHRITTSSPAGEVARALVAAVSEGSR